MSAVRLYSAPNENYLDHISKCKEKFELLFPIFYPTVARTFNAFIDQEILKDAFMKMVLFHDIGKLTRRWQEKVGTGNRLPSHSTPGAAYLWLTLPDEIKEPLVFAVAIHHTDKGLLGDNIERPDVQAILDGIADNSGNIVWHDETKNLTEDSFPQSIRKMNVTALKDMARGLRVWAKGCGLQEQHERRLQASLAHHILKLCDISAAVERKEYNQEDDKDYYGGWLMVKDIKDYVDSLQIRAFVKKIKEKFSPQKIILFGSYAYGIPKKGSDIDLLIIIESDIHPRELAAIIRSEFKGLIPMDIVVRTPQQVEERLKLGDFFIRKIIKEGVLL